MSLCGCEIENVYKWNWYNKDDKEFLKEDGRPIFMSCGNCGNMVLTNASYEWNYCPKCGCRNEGY